MKSLILTILTLNLCLLNFSFADVMDEAMSQGTTLAAAYLGTTLALSKESLEVQPDALIYLSEGTSTPALDSLVESIQEKAKMNGEELTYAEAIEYILNIH
ncbi:MAG: hypothetical protein AB7I27_14305 [Bacteriovoracaceae bacterium]